MAENGRKNRETALLLALASGQTVREAALAASVSERTATRRLADPAFRLKLTELQTEATQRASRQLGNAAAAAVDTLRKLLTADSAAARLGAARSILELGTRLREATELEQRLAALEKHFREKAK